MNISLRNGSVRAIHHDDYADILGGITQRASHVEPITNGPCVGLWFVDMSPLGDEFGYCLWPPFERRDIALQAEHDHIEEHWLKREGVPNGRTDGSVSRAHQA